jgi:hypothetical protein
VKFGYGLPYRIFLVIRPAFWRKNLKYLLKIAWPLGLLLLLPAHPLLGNPSTNACIAPITSSPTPWAWIKIGPKNPNTGTYGASVNYKNQVTINRLRITESAGVLTVIPPSAFEFISFKALADLVGLITQCFRGRENVSDRTECPVNGMARISKPATVTSVIVSHVPSSAIFSENILWHSAVTLDNFFTVRHISTRSDGVMRAPFDIADRTQDHLPQFDFDPDFAAVLQDEIMFAPPFPADRDSKTIPKVTELTFFPFKNEITTGPQILGFYEVALSNGAIIKDIALHGFSNGTKWVIYPNTIVNDGKISHLLIPDQAQRSVIENSILENHPTLKTRAAASALGKVKQSFFRVPISPSVSDFKFWTSDDPTDGVRIKISFKLNDSLWVNGATLYKNGSFEFPTRRRRNFGQVMHVEAFTFQNDGDLEKLIQTILAELKRRGI